jgi:hypothetical protein
MLHPCGLGLAVQPKKERKIIMKNKPKDYLKLVFSCFNSASPEGLSMASF